MKRNINKAFIVYLSCIIATLMFAVIVLGGIFKMFITVPYFDKCLHFLCAALVTSIIGLCLADRAKMRPLYGMLFVFCFAVMIGVIFELMEFTVDSLFATKHQHWIATEADRLGFLGAIRQGSGLIDTMGDIAANTIGAAIASIFGLFWLRKKERCALFL